MADSGARGFKLLCAFVGSFFSLLCLVSWQTGAAELEGDLAREFNHEIWRQEQGLPGGSIGALLQTRDGYLWIGTKTGLARFDGLKFTLFNHVNTSELKDEDCWKLAEDADGSLWIAIHNNLLRRRNQTFTVYHPEVEPYYQGPVNALCARRSGGLWVATPHGVVSFELEKFAWRADWSDSGIPAVGNLHEDPAGMIWVLAARGLICVDPRTGRFVDHSNPPSFGGLPAQALVQSDGSGNLWMLHSGPDNPEGSGQAWLWRFQNDRWINYSETLLSNMGRALFMLVDRSGSLWLPAGQRGLQCLREGKWIRYALPWGLPEDFPTCMTEDREGNLWIGTEAGRLHRLQPKIVLTLTTSDGLAHDDSWTIFESRNGSVWVGTAAGLSQLQTSGTSDVRLASAPSPIKPEVARRRFEISNYSPRDGLADKVIRSLAEDASGTLWVGTGNGLDSFRDLQFTHHRFPGVDHGDLDGKGWNKIYAIAPGQDGSLWAGVPNGLHRLRDGRDTFYTTANGLSTNDVRALLQDRTGNLWIGTGGGGLCRFALTDAAAEISPRVDALPQHEQTSRQLTSAAPRQTTVLTTKDGLSSDFVWALHEDPQGVLWIGTERGLNRLPIKGAARNLASPATLARNKNQGATKPQPSGTIFAFTSHHGLFDDSVNHILEDDLGNFWISTEHGIYRVRKEELNDVAEGRAKAVHSALFDEADGLLSAKTRGQKSQPAGCKTRDGRLWFPTVKGVAIIDPKTCKENNVPPPVVIEQVMADREIIFGDGVGSLTSEIQNKQSLRTSAAARLEPGRARVIEFRYTANSFIASEKIRFQYRLEGYEDAWHDASTRRVAYYTNLAPGEYRFRVRACNHHNVWNESGAVFAFYLAPHYYETWWFYPMCAAAIALCVIGLHRLRVGVMHRIHLLEKQTALAEERQRLAKDMHDDIGSQLNRLALLCDAARSKSGATPPSSSDLAQIAHLAREADRGLDTIVSAFRPGPSTLAQLASYLSQYAFEYLEPTTIRLNLEFPEEPPDWPLSGWARHNLLLTAKEALCNVLQHSSAKTVWIKLQLDTQHFTLEIQDDGKGFLPDARTKFDQTAGNGLRNMEQRVAEAGGRFYLRSQPGSGTTITIRVPKT
jgi:ligand-binding sensor domain-containing protein/signal transduction histidine kinase